MVSDALVLLFMFTVIGSVLFVGWLFGSGPKSRGRCDHHHITIADIRDDLSAVYECDDCGSEVRPSESDKRYVHDPRKAGRGR